MLKKLKYCLVWMKMRTNSFIEYCERENEKSREIIKENGKRAREHHENFKRACR